MGAAMCRGIDHVGMVVPDMEQAVAFFKDVFGAKTAYINHEATEPPICGKPFCDEVRVAETTKLIEFCMLCFPNGGSLELFHYETVEEKRQPLRTSDIGITHVAFYCDGLEAAYQRVLDAGGEMFSPIRELHGEIEEGTGRYVYGATPWGMIIELLEYAPDMINYPAHSEINRYVPG